MTNTRMEEITRNARQAATPVPGSYTAEEARIWQQRFWRAMKGGV